MILLETHSGVFLASLVLIAMTLIVTLSLARKITLKLIPLTIILAAATIFLIIRSLGSCIVIGGSVSIHSINLIPFSTLFKSIEDFQGFQTNEDFVIYYYLPQCKILIITFCFGILWGICAPILFKADSLKKLTVISLCTILPIELLINLCYILQISYENYYDTSLYFLLAIGSALGWLFLKVCNKRHKNREEKFENQ